MIKRKTLNNSALRFLLCLLGNSLTKKVGRWKQPLHPLNPWNGHMPTPKRSLEMEYCRGSFASMELIPTCFCSAQYDRLGDYSCSGAHDSINVKPAAL